jgi:putative ABC transport system permease protein
VVAYRTVRRTREIGIRVALGAGRARVVRLVLMESAKAAALGLALGIPAALATTHVLSALLFGVSPSDPLAFVVAGSVTAGAVQVASLQPPCARCESARPWCWEIGNHVRRAACLQPGASARAANFTALNRFLTKS